MELGLFVVGDADKNYASGVVVQYCGICLILYLLNCLVFLLVPFQFDKERGKSDVLIWQINYISDTSSRRKLVQQSKPPERLRYRSLLFGRTADLIGQFLAPALPYQQPVFPFDKSDLGR